MFPILTRIGIVDFFSSATAPLSRLLLREKTATPQDQPYPFTTHPQTVILGSNDSEVTGKPANLEQYFAQINKKETKPQPTPQEQKLYKTLDRFFATINFQTEEESIKPENVVITKAAFEKLAQTMDWTYVSHSFASLLDEKKDQFYYRADGVTPNWYHEFRELLPFLSLLREGVITEEAMKPHGGIEILISSILRHDSWEDFRISPHEIFAYHEKRLHMLNEAGIISDDELLVERNKAGGIAKIVDLMTRKIPKIDDMGHLAYKPNGKINKEDRYGGDLNEYHQRHLSHVFAVLAKYADSIEGLSTRIIVGNFNPKDGRFSVEDNIKYAEERRALYGRRPTDQMAIEKYPEFAEAIKSFDNMAGITLVVLETVNDYYRKGSKLNPSNGFPIRIAQYISNIDTNFQHIPPAFSADMMQLERLEKIAEKDILMAEILLNCIYPAMLEINPGVAKKQGEMKRKLDELLDQNLGSDFLTLGH